MKGLKLTYSYKTKIVGVITSAIGLAGMLGERIAPFVWKKNWSPEQHYGAFLWVMLLGLYTIAYCKEKYDDERAEKIRVKAFQLAFLLMGSVIMSMALVSTLAKPGDMDVDGPILFMFAELGIITYLLTFYTGLYFDKFWDFDDEDRTIWQHIKSMPKNIGGILVYLLICTITLLLIMLI